MKFVQYTHKNCPSVRLGYVEKDCVVDVQFKDFCMPNTMLEFLQNDYYWKRIRELQHNESSCNTPLKYVNLLAPVTGMDKVLGMCHNYKDLIEINKLPFLPVPSFFGKFASTVIGPNDAVQIRTDVSKKVDWEVELCAVIGRVATFVKAKDAYKYVFGYTVGQDISARDWQREKNLGQFVLGKSQDTFCPIGPWIVTHDEVGDPENLQLSCKVNNVLKQNSYTKYMVYNIPSIIERITTVMTLYPGDIILTGTPQGVGMFHHPAEFLKPGDVIESEVEKIGVLTTKCKEYIKPEEIRPIVKDYSFNGLMP